MDSGKRKDSFLSPTCSLRIPSCLLGQDTLYQIDRRTKLAAWERGEVPELIDHFDVAVPMFNYKHASNLLNANVNQDVFPRMFIMTPNGSLLAYNTPANIKELRDQATLVSMVWKDYAERYDAFNEKEQATYEKQSTQLQKKRSAERDSIAPDSNHQVQDDDHMEAPVRKDLETLTIESENYNIIVRQLQRHLLFVLVGGLPPGAKQQFNVTAEATGDPRYPSEEAPEGLDPDSEASSPSSGEISPGSAVSAKALRRRKPWAEMTQADKDIELGTLHVQRKKADAMAGFIKDDFKKNGFVMPDDVMSAFS